MSEPNEADRERADACASDLLEAVEHALFEYRLSKAFAAHRLTAERAKTAEIVAKLRERAGSFYAAAAGYFPAHSNNAIAYQSLARELDGLADEIESTT
jgi:hypothetical protein